jgi:hypothetical protein
MFMHSTEFDKKIVVSIVIVLFVASLFVRHDVVSDSGTWSEGTVSAPVDTQTEVTEPETTPTETSKPTGSGTSSVLTYEEAIGKYGGFRFQFVDCHGNPGSMTLKKGGTIMLDNRDEKAHTVKVGTRSYALAAYGYKIATANEVGTINITCDGGGAAQLIVQP